MTDCHVVGEDFTLGLHSRPSVEPKKGKESSKNHIERDKAVHKYALPVQGDANGLLLTALDAQHPPPEGSSSLEVAAQPSIVLDNWVECTKRNQWRLALPRVNLDVLPPHWQCQSMTWLPGLNNCTYTEETTTNAVCNYLMRQSPTVGLIVNH
ncbi:hypothetical protein MPTK1_4g11140 [Marchantia polymorpha subsp. ruderalis]|uniref:CW-type domain-containing protein n=2 Tax=Marchantia polymorpha TaxID=3197 RepID=A0AAF6B8P9_MARPO|nr:hypothetical protein MARPO_0011s0099 [Marchantia polymorpha]BBN08383.1 hypothetical protein Mp_4g11140 [Marchantia polymorpha subsp. ruderalis]|eukprot:PTQ46419.1 hypothetical protein MARPO_0011s0099 [Marchantia polymorpha]